MNTGWRRWLHWTPRWLGIAYALFLSLFAFDSWEGGVTFWEGLAGFFVHLLPVYLVVFALLVAWRRPAPGGPLFLVLAIAFSLYFGWREPATLALLAAPLVVVGGLFLLDAHFDRERLRPTY